MCHDCKITSWYHKQIDEIPQASVEQVETRRNDPLWPPINQIGPGEEDPISNRGNCDQKDGNDN